MSQRSRNRKDREPSLDVSMMEELRAHVAVIRENERKVIATWEKILALERRMKQNEGNGSSHLATDLADLEAYYRELVKINEEQTALANENRERITVLMTLVKRKEEETPQSSARNASSRSSGLEFDGPSESPGPSPAENRARKMGGSRTSSQPPRSNTDGASETNERVVKPKIVYSLKEEVAFKRKVPGGKPEDQDWIQGEVVRVIGDGKSRRYEVKDIDPEAAASVNPFYKSSASQMVPIPPEGATLGTYEVGKQVLALYPQATTFYRAEVKSTIDGGARVLVLFDEEDVEKPVARRFVLDHKG
ncbi:hypothetical protein LZ554_001565 [Drepanopeziza brunnea f. sp. 'monogermtubi']|nr:hypothetical protein LZ554_001565 [Drepanopeziza brunnea f. sp. 'monogermtubi']